MASDSLMPAFHFALRRRELRRRGLPIVDDSSDLVVQQAGVWMAR
jgi:hypothetical protein